ncbi:EI24 domain-containing protein [Helicobacter mesocricetorum]|uniref:EI24 domain-containing protein n=1 Tax=Helicobacter mesocricetorum TaxID=87012 RepID=UPI000CF157D2|nr:EI24 domain-containing protein [Helicobacter mesocricetorum]
MFETPTKKLIEIKTIFLQSKNDFFSAYILRLIFLPLFLILIFWATIFYFFIGDIFNTLYSLIHIDLSISINWFSWIQNLLDSLLQITLLLFLGIAFLALTLFSNLILCSFLTPFIIGFIHDKHYPTKVIHSDSSFLQTSLTLLKMHLLYLLILCLLIPLYFIPLIGSLLILIPNYWLFSKVLILDVGENIFNKATFKEIQKNYKQEIRSIIIPLFGLSLLPLLNFFIPFFALIALTHLLFRFKS